MLENLMFNATVLAKDATSTVPTGVDWGFSWAVVVTGLVVVFVVLFLLVFMCSIMGKIFTNIDKNKKLKKLELEKKNVEPAQEKATIVVPDAVESGVSGGVIAAISAAIAVIMGSDGEKKPFVIKSIKKSKGQRSAWNSAGINDNTRQY